MALEHLRRKIAREKVSPFQEKIVSRRADGVPVVYSQPISPDKFWRDLEDSIDAEEDEEEDGDGGYPYKGLR